MSFEGDCKSNLVCLFRAPKETEELDRFEKELSKCGYKPVNVPVLSFKFVKLEQLSQKIRSLSVYGAVIFTSPRSAEAFEKAKALLSPEDLEEISFKDTTAYVVGKGTSEVVKKIGFSPKGEESGNAESLAATIIKEVEDVSKPVLFPCGSLKRDILINKLKEKEFTVESVTVYETDSNPNFQTELTNALQKQGIPEYLVFFSPSGVKFASDVLKKTIKNIESLKFVAIGPTSKTELEKLSFTVHGTAAKPNPDSLVKALKGSEEEESK